MAGRRHAYVGRSVVVIYDESLCQHSEKCCARLPAVFNRDKNPWIEPDQASAQLLLNAVKGCPSNALSFEQINKHVTEIGNNLFIEPGGPLRIKGDLHIKDEQDDSRRVTRFTTFCRCGQSKNKPYCDGSHDKIEFLDNGDIHQISDTRPPSIDSPLRITCKKDGPLLFSGKLILRNRRGKECVLSKGALCRCGSSGNKPFCDGSHNRSGFQTG